MVLIEGVTIGVIGLLIILDPAKANIRVGILLSLGLLIAGLLQSWMLFREKGPESVDGILGARAALGVFSSLIVLWLFMGNLLTVEIGLLILGLGALSYGVLGIFLVFNSLGGTRNSALIETIFFTAFGILVLYSRFVGPTAIVTGIAAIGWLAITIGTILTIYAFIRRGKSEDAEAAASQVMSAASSAASSAQASNTPRDAKRPSGT